MTRTVRAIAMILLTGIMTPVGFGADVPPANPQPQQISPLTPVPFTAVKFTDAFWAPRIETNRTKVVPHNFKMCETTGRIDNFAKAGKLMEGKFRGIYYDDSDLYKAIEGACYTLATHPDPELDKYLDGVIAKIAAAQQPDGYLFTFYTLNGLENRWTNFKDMHELYCAGHLIEAAVAHKLATGKDTLLNVAIKLADHIDSIIGPEPHKKKEICGHEEIELALVKLYHQTKEKRYLNLAKFMIDTRGTDAGGGRKKWGEYWQDHAPLSQQDRPVGHAVRAMYFYTGAADVAAATNDASYLPHLQRLFAATVERRMYITGGVGARHAGEAFGDDYELPNESAYCETCAAIGNALYNNRMNLLTGDAKYADVVERVIYNGMLSGVSFSGDRFFYVNPLASRGKHHRQEWFGTACCPSNVVRFLPSLPGYMYATKGNSIYVNLFAASTATIDLNGNKVTIIQETNYPWDGKVLLRIDPTQEAEFDLAVRFPSWCKGADVKINDQYLKDLPDVATLKGATGYLALNRRWKRGDVLAIEWGMPIERVYSHSQVKANVNRVALQRGPIVYCLEAADNNGKVYNLSLPKTSDLKAEHRPDLLNGVTMITGNALAHTRGARKEDADPNLVKPADRAQDTPVTSTEVPFTAVPYYAWDHRQPGEMQVWVAEDPSAAQPTPAPTLASRSKPSASHTWRLDTVEALNDQLEPASSHDTAIPRFTWWDRKGGEQWAQLDLPEKATIREAEVYFFEDAPSGGCRLPASWKLLCKTADGQWKEVEAVSDYPADKDRFNKVTFTPVETTALRLVAQLQPNFSGGILEWRMK